MPKLITNVKWTASGLPSGLSFDTNTGTFSGTPIQTGEYTVPVSVTTNYGSDMKDVSINAVRAYPIYAIGSNAATWSENAEPDEYGFRKLNMPNAYKLLKHYGGFGAKIPTGDYYCCGVYDVPLTQSTSPGSVLKRSTTPKKLILDDLFPYSNIESLYGDKIEQTRLLHFKESTSTKSGTDTITRTYEQYRLMFVTNLLRIVSLVGPIYCTDKSTGGTNSEYWTYGSRGVMSTTMYVSNMSRSLVEPCPDIASAHAWAHIAIDKDNNNLIYNVRPIHPEYHNSYNETESSELNFRVKKLLAPNNSSLFEYLSEDGLLDNDSSRFGLGNIDDAWVYSTKAYVLTEINELYEATGTRKNYSWTDQGAFSIKKLEMPSTKITFMLTTDGKIYHKGSAVTNVTDKHETFTQIFPNCYFHDFTFDSNTLTVLREE